MPAPMSVRAMPIFTRQPARLSGEAHDAADSLHHLVVGRARPVGPGLAEPGDGCSIRCQGSVALTVLVPQMPKPVHHPGGEVLHYHIRVPGQFEENLLGLGVAQIEG